MDQRKLDRYEQEQRRYWNQLRQELQRYKEELGATHSELAEGLAISRQPLVSFMQDDRPDLPIHRAHLIRLWNRLTAPQDRRLSEARLSKRQVLQQEGPDRLLRAAGFLPEEESLKLDANPDRYQQIQRIVAGLSNIPAGNDTDFIDLVDSIETDFISKAFGFKRLSPAANEDVFSPQKKIEHKINQWLDRWIKENLYTEPLSHIKSRFKRAIYKLIKQGKEIFKDQEIFELYLSILENYRVDKKVETGVKLRVAQCQFSNLTFSILDQDSSDDQAFRDELIRLFLSAEAQLQFSDDQDFLVANSNENERYLRSVVEDVVTEASVTCILRMKDDSSGCDCDRIRWTCSSSTTHFENMFTAIYQGLGCERDLELVDFSTASLGKRSDSLMKSSTAFKSQTDKRLHQGIWVDRSTVVGTAQSIVVAVKSWLADQLPEPVAYRAYYEACRAIASIDNCLSDGCKFLSDYVLQQPEDPQAVPARKYLAKEVITRIDQLRQGALADAPILQDWYGLDLQRKYCRAQIACARSCHVEGDLKSAAQFLVKAQETLDAPGVQEDVPLALRLQQEQMLQSFYSGDQAFIHNRVWRQTPQRHLQTLRNYIYGESLSSAHHRYCGRLDPHVYLCAAEILARVGRLEISFATSPEASHLAQAAENLLMAAYYASKAGERQRAAHWLANASRVYCRLGDGDKAAKLVDIAARVLNQAIDQRYSAQYKLAIVAEVDISRGEKALLIDRDPLQALQHFGRSLRGAAYLSFVRLLADSLYNIARAAEALKQPMDIALLQGDYDMAPNRFINPLVKDAMTFLASLDSQATWAEAAPQFKQQAQKIWHHWAVTTASDPQVRHPIEQEIEQGAYLCRVS